MLKIRTKETDSSDGSRWCGISRNNEMRTGIKAGYYCNELVETGWTPREADTEGKENSCLWCGKEYQTATTGRKRKFCSDQCRRKYYMLYPTTPRSSAQCVYYGKVFERVNSKQKFCSHEWYIKSRFWSKEDAEQMGDVLMIGEKINIPQWLWDKLKEQL